MFGVFLLGRKVGKVLVYLKPIGGLGNVLFLKSCLLPIRCICAGLILLGVVNEFRVNTNRISNDAHNILGECAGLVSTSNGGVCNNLARAEEMNRENFSGHSLHNGNEYQSCCKRKKRQLSRLPSA